MRSKASIIASITPAILALHGTAMAQFRLDSCCKPLPIDVVQLVQLSDGRLLTTEGTGTKTAGNSRDTGNSRAIPDTIHNYRFHSFGPGFCRRTTRPSFLSSRFRKASSLPEPVPAETSTCCPALTVSNTCC
jgi:hypothetical protein